MQYFLFKYFNQTSKRKVLKSRHFELISIKTDSSFYFNLKSVYRMSCIKTLLSRKKVHLNS